MGDYIIKQTEELRKYSCDGNRSQGVNPMFYLISEVDPIIFGLLSEVKDLKYKHGHHPKECVCGLCKTVDRLEAENAALKELREMTRKEMLRCGDGWVEEQTLTSTLKEEVKRLTGVLKVRVWTIEDWMEKCDKLEEENAKLKESQDAIQWYVDYANDKDKDVCKWIGEANKLEAENAALKATAAQLATAVIHAHRYTIARPASDNLEYHPVCQCDDCKMAREVINKKGVYNARRI